MLDKLLSGFGKKHEVAKDNALAMYKDKLKGLVYDEDLVTELAPIFAKLHGSEGFDKVMSLLETKEQQITSISGGEWFQQESDDNQHQDKKDDTSQEENKTLTAEEILAEKFK